MMGRLPVQSPLCPEIVSPPGPATESAIVARDQRFVKIPQRPPAARQPEKPQDRSARRYAGNCPSAAQATARTSATSAPLTI